VELSLRLVRGGLVKILADLLDVTVAGNHTGLIGSAHLGLFVQGTPGFSESLTLADIVEATYDGYARLPVAWGSTGQDPLGRPSVHGTSDLFSPTGSVTPNTLTGVFIADALAAGNLLGLAYFPAQIIFNGIEDDLTIVPVVKIPSDLDNWGAINAIQ